MQIDRKYWQWHAINKKYCDIFMLKDKNKKIINTFFL